MTRRRLFALSSLLIVACALGAAAVAILKPGEQMTDAAKRFIATLSDEQKKAAIMPYDSPDRVKWHFIPMASRKGLQVKLMDEKQRRAAYALTRSALSQVGYDKARTIMELESILKVLQKNEQPIRDPHRYYITIFGEPAADATWGLSIEGHHLSLNFVVERNQVIAHTPAFFGGNPAVVNMDVNTGPVRDTFVLEKEEVLAFELLAMLNEDQRKAAVIAAKAPADIRAAATPQPPADAAEGVAAGKLDAKQAHKLWALIHVHADNMPLPIAEARLKEIAEAGFDKVHFAWAGADKPGVGHYYRVQGPTFLIEYCNTQADGAGNPAAHPHTVWRDMRGDFAIKR